MKVITVKINDTKRFNIINNKEKKISYVNDNSLRKLTKKKNKLLIMVFIKTNCVLKLKIIIGYINDYHIKQTKRFLYTLQRYNYINYINNKTCLHIILCHNKDQFKRDTCNIKDKISYLSISNRKFCIKTLSKDPNIFGNLSYNKYEKIKMDKLEEKEEKFAENIIVPKREKFTNKDYYTLIKSHLINKNLQLALSVLDLMKENDDKPNLYIYRLLISGFAKQGDIKQCFKLFKQIKERGLNLSPHIYSSLINACSEAKDRKEALKHLIFLRNYFYEKKINLNNIHYSCLIKAYSWHKQISIAFEIADEAKDNGIYSQDIISALFHAIISDTENGLKYALCLWHKMKIIKMKPNIFHYNLLLKAIRDTKFGDLKVNDILIPNSKDSQIQFMETGRSDLLDSPPVLTTSLILMLKKYNYFISNNENSEININDESTLLSQNLNNILKENRLFLFGGIDKFLKRMKNDGVKPDLKTITLILDLLPPTIKAEEYFLKYITSNNLKIDITFFNILIKRRCLRKQYNVAKVSNYFN